MNISLPDKTFLSKNNFLTAGGNEHLAAFSMANWVGATPEEVVSYENAEEVYHNGLDSAYAFSKSIAHLENVRWLNLNDFVNVKAKIMKYGSGTLSFYSDNTASSKYYKSSTGGYYYWGDHCFSSDTKDFVTNHQVTVVGWDDNYSKSNFAVEPKDHGAWLVKNSWGSGFGNSGYIWLSYYDKSIYAETAGNSYGNDIVFWDFGLADNYDNNYYYDGSSSINWWYFWEDVTKQPRNEMSMSNIFTAQYKETIEAASFFTFQDNLVYRVEIYTHIPENGTPFDGTLAASVSGLADYYGYHTIDLPDSILVEEGTRFAVAVTLDTQVAGQAVYLPTEGDGSWSWGVEFAANAKAGESYYKEPNSNWYPMVSGRDSLNFRIKAFTNTVNENQLGDMNFDGVINAQDALFILKLAAGINNLSYKMSLVGDVSKDKEINAQDALLVLKKTANIIADFS